jgi:arginase family enzyme
VSAGEVASIDVVELNPARNPSGVTARTADWIITHSLAEIFDLER